MQASIIIRTLNEAQYLGQLLASIASQQASLGWEVVIVDSGSTDATLDIAKTYHCVIRHIRKEDFSFGRSLNIGCEAAKGEILVLISGHCVPTDEHWLQKLCEPLLEEKADYSYGRQLGGQDNYYSEHRIFAKYYPKQSQIPQQGFFCNNANAAIKKQSWQDYHFDENITGLEDMELAKRLVNDGANIAYVAEASVYHHHLESWAQVRRRFEREAIALQKIMPQVHIRIRDLVKYIAISIVSDIKHANRESLALRYYPGIFRYRMNQYWGSYKGNHEHRKLSQHEKEKYFYPVEVEERKKNEQTNYRSLASYEGKQ